MLMNKELAECCVLYALTPVHAGSGQALGTVDLPIQRERHTQWPQVQSSGVKGAFRDWFVRYYLENGNEAASDKERQAEKLASQVFGKEEGGEGNNGQAGAVSVTDARLLAFPVRSNIAPFVWVTCPAILTRLKRDLELCGSPVAIPIVAPAKDDDGVDVSCGAGNGKQVVLEDMVVTAAANDQAGALKTAFATLTPQVERLLLVSDNAFSFLVETATEVQPQIKIDMATGTTVDGSLRYQELLPADSVLYLLMFFGQERKKEGPEAATVLRELVKTAISAHVQIGGDMTLGRGIMAVNWLAKAEK
ncbi:MAG TPA: type III-B CRISPR module RAMP protein Cmr4 [Desulfobacteraceae bacterium]|nr:type III-B CRISPR module RAMP protein Cmr4 [Desulfobacteraceae bacterium]